MNNKMSNKVKAIIVKTMILVGAIICINTTGAKAETTQVQWNNNWYYMIPVAQNDITTGSAVTVETLTTTSAAVTTTSAAVEVTQEASEVIALENEIITKQLATHHDVLKAVDNIYTNGKNIYNDLLREGYDKNSPIVQQFEDLQYSVLCMAKDMNEEDIYDFCNEYENAKKISYTIITK